MDDMAFWYKGYLKVKDDLYNIVVLGHVIHSVLGKEEGGRPADYE